MVTTILFSSNLVLFTDAEYVKVALSTTQYADYGSRITLPCKVCPSAQGSSCLSEGNGVLTEWFRNLLELQTSVLLYSVFTHSDLNSHHSVGLSYQLFNFCHETDRVAKFCHCKYFLMLNRKMLQALLSYVYSWYCKEMCW